MVLDDCFRIAFYDGWGRGADQNAQAFARRLEGALNAKIEGPPVTPFPALDAVLNGDPWLHGIEMTIRQRLAEAVGVERP